MSEEKKEYTREELRQAFADGAMWGLYDFRGGHFTLEATAKERASDIYPAPKKLRVVTACNGVRYRVVNGVLEYFSDLAGAWRPPLSANVSDVLALADLIARPYEEPSK